MTLRIEGWLRLLPDALSRELRREWSRLRELGKDDLTLDTIERLRRAREAAREPRGVGILIPFAATAAEEVEGVRERWEERLGGLARFATLDASASGR